MEVILLSWKLQIGIFIAVACAAAWWYSNNNNTPKH